MINRSVLIGAGIVAALALVGWFSVHQSSSKRTARSSSDAMPGMTMTDASSDTAGHGTAGMSMGHSGSMTGMKPLVTGADGTRGSAAGLTLEPQHSVFSAGQSTQLQLRVVDRRKMVVTKFERDQTKLMHLIVVRSDLTGYQHVHPVLSRTGIFTIGLRLPRRGNYHAIADFTTGGHRYALGVPITVPGSWTKAPLPAESMHAASDGYSVKVKHGKPRSGSETGFQFTVLRDGQPVTALLAYLGAYGHLVALHRGDLAYSHVHPTSETRSKGLVRFVAEFPARGAYRLFLQFRTSSGVHTAPFTVSVTS